MGDSFSRITVLRSRGIPYLQIVDGSYRDNGHGTMLWLLSFYNVHRSSSGIE